MVNDYRNYYGLVSDPVRLQHHGIKGQRWGERNGPPYPLDSQDRSAREKKKQSSSTSHKQGMDPRLKKALLIGATVSAASIAGYATYKYVSANGADGIKEAADAVKSAAGMADNKVTDIVDTGRKYVEKAVNTDKTTLADIVDTGRKYVEKAVNTDKTTLADIRNELASTTLLGQNRVDTYLKEGTEFKRIQTSDKFEDHAYYATYKKHDIDEYTGLFGKNLRKRAGNDQMDIYQMSLKANSKIRVPSTQNAAKITANLLSDKQFKNDLIASIDDSADKMRRPNQLALFSSAKRALAKNPSNLSDGEKATIYKALNLSLTNHNSQEIAVQNKFYSAMKKAGYGALVDLNDQSYSSYHAKRPMIVFDTSSTDVSNIRKVSNEEINKNYTLHNVERLLKDSITTGVTAVPNYIRYGSDYVRDYFDNDYKRKR